MWVCVVVGGAKKQGLKNARSVCLIQQGTTKYTARVAHCREWMLRQSQPAGREPDGSTGLQDVWMCSERVDLCVWVRRGEARRRLGPSTRRGGGGKCLPPLIEEECKNKQQRGDAGHDTLVLELTSPQV